MRPSVVADFVAFARSARNDLGMRSNVCPNYEESRFEMMRREDIQQFRSERGVWSIVETDRDVRSINMNPAERDARLARRNRLIFFRRLRRNRAFRPDGIRDKERQAKEEGDYQMENGHERKGRIGCVYVAEAARNARESH